MQRLMIRDMGMHQYLVIIAIMAIFTHTASAINTNDNNGNGVSSSRGSASRSGGEVLIFADDFTDFDLSKWEHEITMGGGGNWEFEYYTNNRSNSYVKNGVLYIKPTLTSDLIGEANVRNNYRMDLWGAQPAALCTGNAFYGCERTSGAGGNILNPIQSARLRTSSSMNVKYGRIEVNAKLPSGDWIWPAIWMMPRYNSYGNWPASGEIDIMESRGNDASYPAGGRNAFSSTLHWGPFFPLDPFVKTHAEYRLPSGTFADSFHTFGMYWNDSGLYTYVDNPSNKVLQVNWNSTSFWQRGGWDTSSFDNPWAGRGNGAPFDREFYLILNVAVGGIADYFPDGMGGKPWSNRDDHAVNAFYDAKGNWYSTWSGEKTALQIDWVKVWQLQ